MSKHVHIYLGDSFEESKHPRDGGKFASSGAGATGHHPPGQTAAAHAPLSGDAKESLRRIARRQDGLAKMKQKKVSPGHSHNHQADIRQMEAQHSKLRAEHESKHGKIEPHHWAQLED